MKNGTKANLTNVDAHLHAPLLKEFSRFLSGECVRIAQRTQRCLMPPGFKVPAGTVDRTFFSKPPVDTS